MENDENDEGFVVSLEVAGTPEGTYEEDDLTVFVDLTPGADGGAYDFSLTGLLDSLVSRLEDPEEIAAVAKCFRVVLAHMTELTDRVEKMASERSQSHGA